MASRRGARAPWRSGCAIAVSGLVSAAACGDAPTRPSSSIDGVYTFRVQSSCVALPVDLRNRAYVATISAGRVTLSGATFWMHPREGLRNTFSVSVFGTSVTFNLEQPSPDSVRGIVEQTSATTYFGISGSAQGSIEEGPGGRPAISGTFAAGFGFGENLLYDDQHVGCPSGAHRATFRFDPDRSSAPAPGVAATLQRIELKGPSTLSPGEAAQFEVTGYLPDGSTRDATAETRWNFRQGSPIFGLHAVITPGGVVTGRTVGDDELSAFVSVPNLMTSLTSKVDVVVTPPGTFRLAGRVTVGGSASDPVVGAEVTVTAGAAEGLSATTDWEGRYKMFGVSGPTTLRIVKRGYVDQARDIAGAANDTLDVALPLAGVLPDVAGSYTLTATADPACRENLPEAARVRQYSATIVQTGSIVEARLTGASWDSTIAGQGDRFPGRVEPGTVRFQLAGIDYWGLGAILGPYLGELLPDPPGTSLVLWGNVTSVISGLDLPGTLDGSFVLHNRSIHAIPQTGTPIADCSSRDHAFTFTRR